MIPWYDMLDSIKHFSSFLLEFTLLKISRKSKGHFFYWTCSLVNVAITCASGYVWVEIAVQCWNKLLKFQELFFHLPYWGKFFAGINFREFCKFQQNSRNLTKPKKSIHKIKSLSYFSPTFMLAVIPFAKKHPTH